ncbi:type II toxin-antitoxin system HicA family toxin [Stenoxybacter acetivorans]|uniref:type II toxin-antitoxin system HicA family toxin n=1 Tax=Stenoxybacter acetivorans TaxID=422441 RepID=UPI000562A5A5|nr:type II toxin-antitoxin system HicA family toxin [Stenoxybacter acetivorans]
MTSDEIIKRLKADGWYSVGKRGSHEQFKHDSKTRRVTVPHPKKDLPIGTIHSIFKQAGWK